MKILLPAMLTVSLLLMVGSAASQDPAPSKEVLPVQAPASRQAADTETAPPELKRLAGSYTLIGNQTDGAAVVNKAIDAATADMSG